MAKTKSILSESPIKFTDTMNKLQNAAAAIKAGFFYASTDDGCKFDREGFFALMSPHIIALEEVVKELNTDRIVSRGKGGAQ